MPRNARVSHLNGHMQLISVFMWRGGAGGVQEGVGGRRVNAQGGSHRLSADLGEPQL